MTTVVELRQVSKVYGSGPAEVHALREVDLSVRAGELVAVMGRAGPARARCSPRGEAVSRPPDGGLPARRAVLRWADGA